MSVHRILNGVRVALRRFSPTRLFRASIVPDATIAPVRVLLSVVIAASASPAVAAGLPTPALPFEAVVQWITTSATIGSEKVAYARFRTALSRPQVRQATLAAWSAGGLLIERELDDGWLLSRRDGAALTTLWLESVRSRIPADDRRGSGGYLIVSESLRPEPSVPSTGSTDGCGLAQLVPPGGDTIRPIAFDDGGRRACQMGIRFALNPNEARVLLERQWRGAGMAPMNIVGASAPSASDRSTEAHSAAMPGRVLHFASTTLELLAWLSPGQDHTWVALIVRQRVLRADEDRNEQHGYERPRREGPGREGPGREGLGRAALRHEGRGQQGEGR